MITAILALSAIAAALWPSRPPANDLFSPPAAAALSGGTYEGAIRALATVRNRLLATGALTEKERAAVDALTLALVGGSEKP
jgi:hypothetical protein